MVQGEKEREREKSSDGKQPGSVSKQTISTVLFLHHTAVFAPVTRVRPGVIGFTCGRGSTQRVAVHSRHPPPTPAGAQRGVGVGGKDIGVRPNKDTSPSREVTPIRTGGSLSSSDPDAETRTSRSFQILIVSPFASPNRAGPLRSARNRGHGACQQRVLLLKQTGSHPPPPAVCGRRVITALKKRLLLRRCSMTTSQSPRA